MKCLDLYWWVCPRLCVGPCTCWIRSKVFKTVTISFVVLISALSMWILKSPAIAKQSNSEEIIDNSSVNSSTKAGEYFGYSSGEKQQSPALRSCKRRQEAFVLFLFYFIRTNVLLLCWPIDRSYYNLNTLLISTRLRWWILNISCIDLTLTTSNSSESYKVSVPRSGRKKPQRVLPNPAKRHWTGQVKAEIRLCPSLTPLTDLFTNPRTVTSAVPRQQRDQSPGEHEPERPHCERTPGGIGASAREAHRSAHSQRSRALNNAGRDERTY